MKYKDFYDIKKSVKKTETSKTPTIKKESVLDGIKKELNESAVHLMKVTTMKDNPPFKTPKQIEEEKLNEVDFSKVKLPPMVNRWLNKFVDSMKEAQLNRLKRSAILYKVINASGISTQQLMADIQKIKKEL